MPDVRATIGVIGGTGLYSLVDHAESVDVDTPWGEPSDVISVAAFGGRPVAFVPRHGRGHTVPPHRINYRANLWALHSLGVERVLAPCASGSLSADRSPGAMVVCDQYVNLTSGRADTYFDGPEVAHLSAAYPYCEELRPLAVAAARAAGMPTHQGGTVAVVNGPRFGTRAESHWLRRMGCDVVNMTQYPEVTLARELGMCYVGMALVTDYDSGIEDDPEIRPVKQEDVVAVFGRSTERLRETLRALVEQIHAQRTCGCAAAPTPINR